MSSTHISTTTHLQTPRRVRFFIAQSGERCTPEPPEELARPTLEQESRIPVLDVAFGDTLEIRWRIHPLMKKRSESTARRQQVKPLKRSVVYRFFDAAAHLFGAHDERTPQAYRGGMERGVELVFSLESATRR